MLVFTFDPAPPLPFKSEPDGYAESGIVKEGFLLDILTKYESGVLKMVGPKKQDFWQKSIYSKETIVF